jgi:hypothetical protein
MPTAAESTVLRTLSAIEVDGEAAAGVIQDLGNEGVTVLCEVALGTFPGLRAKIRANAVVVLASVNHPQAQEALHLLIRDPSPDFSIRALRAVARRKDLTVVAELGTLLRQATLPPLVAAETVLALRAFDSTDARQILDTYRLADPGRFPHRGAAAVQQALQTTAN